MYLAYIWHTSDIHAQLSGGGAALPHLPSAMLQSSRVEPEGRHPSPVKLVWQPHLGSATQERLTLSRCNWLVVLYVGFRKNPPPTYQARGRPFPAAPAFACSLRHRRCHSSCKEPAMKKTYHTCPNSQGHKPSLQDWQAATTRQRTRGCRSLTASSRTSRPLCWTP